MYEFHATLAQVVSFASENLWVVTSALAVLLGCIGIAPTEPHANDTTTIAAAKLFRRLVRILVIFCVGIIPPLLALAMAGVGVQTTVAWSWYRQLYPALLLMPATGLVIGWGLAALSSKLIKPKMSSFFRKIAGEQSGDQMVDRRLENGKFSKIIFDAESLWECGYITLGVTQDIDGELMKGDCRGLESKLTPVSIPIDTWRGSNVQCMGATTYGKGVAMTQAMMQQIIAGDTVIAIDPKPDTYQAHLLHQAAKKAGRQVYYVDLVTGRSGYNPFVGGTLRERRDRLFAAFGLNDGGTDADFYKGIDRARVRKLMTESPETGHLLYLWRRLCEKNAKIVAAKKIPSTSKLEESIEEWSSEPALIVTKGTGSKTRLTVSRGLNIAKQIKNGAVIYVRSDLNNAVVRGATKCLITEVVQACFAQRDGRPHVSMYIDEARKLVSEPVVTALSTGLGVHLNVVLQYQNATDMRNLDDPNIDKKAAEDSINGNSSIKFIYGDGITNAHYAEELSGVVHKKVFDREQTEIEHLGESFTGSRMLSRAEEALIPATRVLAFPKGVGAFFCPERPPTIVWTHWIPCVDKLPGFLEPVKNPSTRALLNRIWKKELNKYVGVVLEDNSSDSDEESPQPPPTETNDDTIGVIDY